MCGIAGIVRFDGPPVREDELRFLAARMAHRGPDGEGVWTDGPFGLAHRRLAILDPAGGAQPLANEDGRVWVAFNGEIYNFRELRAELVARGHVFRTNGDTEVLVHGWEEWREELPRRLRGMFAFAIVDRASREVFLARDPLGIKPLVVEQRGKTFRFASEIATLDDGTASVDYAAIDEYLWLGYITAPRTALQGIEKVEPGTSILFSAEATRRKRFWSWEAELEARAYENWLEEVDEAVDESVRAHLVSDVPFGAFLSGGVDSSLVVDRMAKHLPRPVETFSIGFEEPEYDERAYAEEAARAFGTKHRVEVVRPDALALLPSLVRHYGEPFGDASAVPTWHVCKLAREHVPMVLSGDGGDEFFGGYHSYRAYLQRLGNPERVGDPMLLTQWHRFFEQQPAIARGNLWRREVFGLVGAAEASRAALARELGGLPAVTAAQRMDQRTYLPFDILVKVDIASMMHGLEVRTPLVDVRIAALANRIPPSAHFSSDAGRVRGKRLLKDLLARKLGRPFVDRKKMGFGLPVDRWLGAGGSHEHWLKDRLLGRGSPTLELFEPERVFDLASGGAVGPIWQLLVLDEWLRQRGRAPEPRAWSDAAFSVTVVVDRGVDVPCEADGQAVLTLEPASDREAWRDAAKRLEAERKPTKWIARGRTAKAVVPFVAAARGEACVILDDDGVWASPSHAPFLASEIRVADPGVYHGLETRGFPRVRLVPTLMADVQQVSCPGEKARHNSAWWIGEDRVELDTNEPLEEAMEEVVERCASVGGKALLVYGAGEAGRRLVRIARRRGLTIRAVVDGNQRRHGRAFEGLILSGIDEGLRAEPDAIAIATLRHVDGILDATKAALARAGLRVPVVAPRYHEGSA
jgi:asparagine synthase (glutamine-hydrolysing)